MAKNIFFSEYGFLDKPGNPVTDWPRALEFTITEGTSTQVYLTGIANILMTLDVDANYMEIRTDTAVIYKYEAGDTFNSSAVANAQAMYTQLQTAIVG